MTRWILALIAAATCNFPVFTGVAYASDALAGNEIVSGRLENGLRYVLVRKSGPNVAVRFTVDAGIEVERPNETGVAHIIEHLAFNGSRHYPRGELRNWMAQRGIEHGLGLTGATGFYSTQYGIDIPHDADIGSAEAIGVLRDWADGITINANTLNLERGVVIDEGRGYEALAPQFISIDKLLGSARHDLRIQHDKVVKAVSVSTVEQFYHRWYRPSLITVVVVGDIDISEWKAEITRQLGSLSDSKQNAIPAVQRAGTVRYNGRVFLIPLHQPVGWSVRTFAVEAADTAMDTFEAAKKSLIGQLSAHILTERVRRSSNPEIRKLFVSVNGPDLQMLDLMQGVSIKSNATKENLDKVLRNHQNFIRHTAGVPVSKDEFQQATLLTRIDIGRKLDSASAIAQHYIDHRDRAVSPPPYIDRDQQDQILASITPSDIDNFLSRVLRPAQVQSAVFLPDSEMGDVDLERLKSSSLDWPSAEMPQPDPKLAGARWLAEPSSPKFAAPLPIAREVGIFALPNGLTLVAAQPAEANFTRGISIRASGPLSGDTYPAFSVGVQITLDGLSARDSSDRAKLFGIRSQLSSDGKQMSLSIEGAPGQEVEVFRFLASALRRPVQVIIKEGLPAAGSIQSNSVGRNLESQLFIEGLENWFPQTLLFSGFVDQDYVASLAGGINLKNLDAAVRPCFDRNTRSSSLKSDSIDKEGSLKFSVELKGNLPDPICFSLFQESVGVMLDNELRYRLGKRYGRSAQISLTPNHDGALVEFAFGLGGNSSDRTLIESGIIRVLTELSQGNLDRNVFETEKLKYIASQRKVATDPIEFGEDVQKFLASQIAPQRFAEARRATQIDFRELSAFAAFLLGHAEISSRKAHSAVSR